jgi:hypothetical protein
LRCSRFRKWGGLGKPRFRRDRMKAGDHIISRYLPAVLAVPKANCWFVW